MTISPLINTDRKWGAFPIMLKKIKRTIGVAIVRGNANLELSCLHYVGATAEEAVATCRENHSNNKWIPGQNSRASRFTEHVPEEYGTFVQFRNGYDFCIH